MKKRPTPKQSELNYTIRRVAYNALILAESLDTLTNSRVKFAKRQTAKIAALIMLRNLSAFLYGNHYKEPDDIYYSDFKLPNWKPKQSARLRSKDVKRIHKIAGHIVSSKPSPFNSSGEIESISLPVLEQTCTFLNQCINEGIAKYTGNAPKYVRKINQIIRKLGLEKLDE